MHISNQHNVMLYLGSKFSLMPWLAPRLPKCHVRVDLFGGSGNVTMNLEPAPVEVYNDINKSLYNFYHVLRTRPEELITLLELTPHSRYEYEQAWYHPDDTPVEAARKFFVRTTQSFFATGAQSQLKGWLASTKESRRGISQATHKWLKSVAGLWEVAERFRRVQIECRDFEWVMKTYDGPDTLFYCDPPYDEEHRSNRNDYQFDFNREDQIRLRDAAKKLKGKVAISGYDSDFMRELYQGFNYEVGPERRNNYSTKAVRECLVTNYVLPKTIPSSLFT
jgi:DNA adenine methylase